MKIVRLKSENVKRLQAVEIEPDGNVVTICGKNGAGKSSVLDSIAMALGGAGEVPGKPIREGETAATIEVEIDGDPRLLVVRKMREGKNPTLEIRMMVGDDGVTTKVTSPQKMLDAMAGKIAFDPLEFTRMKPGDQLTALKEIVGVSTDDIDIEIQTIYDRRTAQNKEVARLGGVLNSLPWHDDAPGELVSSSELLDELKKANDHNEHHQRLIDFANDLENDWMQSDREVANSASEIVDLRRQLEEAEERHKELEQECSVARGHLENAQKAVAESALVDTSPIEKRIAELDEVNDKVRENIRHTDATNELKEAKAESQELTDMIDTKRNERLALMDGAKWPVDGLGFGNGGVMFNGIPFDQCSSAEKLRISAAIGLSQKPKLPVLLIRDGSLLDDDSMSAIHDIATEHDAQIWIERVSDGEECSVVIEDGHVAEPREDGHTTGDHHKTGTGNQE